MVFAIHPRSVSALSPSITGTDCSSDGLALLWCGRNKLISSNPKQAWRPHQSHIKLSGSVSGPVNDLHAAHTAAIQNGLYRPLQSPVKWELELHYPINLSAGGPSPLCKRLDPRGARERTQDLHHNYYWARAGERSVAFSWFHSICFCEVTSPGDSARTLQGYCNYSPQSAAITSSYIIHKQGFKLDMSAIKNTQGETWSVLVLASMIPLKCRGGKK